MTDIFLSYKREDRVHAKAIAEFLVAEGYDVWWDIELLPGDQFADEINAVLQIARAVVVLWTPEATSSSWVKSEAMLGLRRNNLVPVMLRESQVPVPFNSIQTLDLTGWSREPQDPALQVLLAAIGRQLGESRRRSPKRSPEEVSDRLKRPEHEVEFWTSVTGSSHQTEEEYQLYLDRYGENGSFSELAKQRIHALRRKKRRLLPKLGKATAVLGTFVAIAVGLFTIAQIVGVFDDETSAPKEELVCSYIDIKSMGWNGGHKTDFCKSAGYEGGNFNIGEYRDGGICLKGPEPDVCKVASMGRLPPRINCRQNGGLTSCYRTEEGS